MATIEKTTTTTYPAPGEPGSPVELKPRYENFIGGRWVAADRRASTRRTVTPATGEPFTEVPRSTPEDVELALDAAHAAKDAWGEASTTERSRVLNTIADAIEENLEMLAVAESWENGKPVRETLAADIPLAADHFRYFASVIRGEEGSISEIDKDTVAYHFHEPLGVVGQIIPFNFPLLMAAWKLAPALAAGNCTVLKPASPTPWSILKLAELIEDIVPPGVLNIVNGPGAEIGKALATSKRIAKIAFTGETVHRPADHAVRRAEHHPVDDRARRQVAEHLLRRRDGRGRRVPRQGDRGPRALRLQQGRGLHVPVAGADPGVDLRRVHGAVPRADRARSGRATRSTSTTQIGAAGLDRAAREDRELRRDRARRGRGAADRRRAQSHLGGELDGGYYFEPTVFKGDERRCGSSRRRSSARCSP